MGLFRKCSLPGMFILLSLNRLIQDPVFYSVTLFIVCMIYEFSDVKKDIFKQIWVESELYLFRTM